MNPEAPKRLRILVSLVSVLVVLGLLAGGWLYWRIRSSLPQLDGSIGLTGLSGPVTVERDHQGVPTLRGRNRPDLARALGWLHAQDRFFQMDLLRRSPAGELAEMFGQRALARDQAMRMHGFRRVATQVVAALPPDERALLDAYVAGVNAGLTALGERPFEYLILRQTPAPWKAEDSILINYAMTLDLQDETGRYERTLMTLRDQFGRPGLAFFAPLETPADAALDASTAPVAAIPAPKVLDLRRAKVVAPVAHHPARRASPEAFPFPDRDAEAVSGSNAFALPGSLTASGAAILANDMHLDHGVPNIWYRASFEYDDRKITGVTLPGLPLMITGSNGHVAWGFTASYADTGDVVVVEANDVSQYLAPGAELVTMEEREETIRVKGDDAVNVTYQWTRWGPIVGTNDLGKPLAYRWTAHDPAATNLGLVAMEGAMDVPQAVAIAHRSGTPALNIVIADRAGRAAWTIAGRLPRRFGYDGRLPVAWTYGDRRWDGFLPEAEIPTVIVGARQTGGDRLWSGNQRMLGGEALTKIGDGGYPRPHRAAQIRDGLAALRQATPRDLLAVQLDDRALFLAPWQELLMKTLTPELITAKPARGRLRAYVEKWEGRASIDAVSYRLVREFRTAVRLRIFPAIFATCLEVESDFRWEDLQLEEATWTLLREQPPHLLNPAFLTWDDLLTTAVDDAIAVIDGQGMKLPQANWGWRNTTRIRHPFSASYSFLSGWLDLPAEPLPGDTDMPRVQSPDHGASERMVVSPGREAEGIFHMPGGQSGHPLSPFYRAGHEAWARGEASPFLPGPAVHTLTFAAP